MLIFWFLLSPSYADPQLNISTDGLGLIFCGSGSISQTLARSKGSYQKIKSVIIDGPSTLEERAFSFFSSLETINLSDTVSSILSNCFQSCTSLMEFTFPFSFTTISDSLFYGCSNLQKVRINASVSSINTNVLFCGCNSLSKFEVSIYNNNFKNDESGSFILSKDGTVLICAPATKNQTIPKSVTKIDLCAYYGFKLQMIDFSQSKLEYINKYAFRMIEIPSLVFPSTLMHVQDNAFFQSTISSLSFPSSLTYFGSNALESLDGLFELNVETSLALIKENGFVMDSNKQIIFFVDKSETELLIEPTIESIEMSLIRKPHVIECNIKPGNTAYSSHGGVVYNADGTILLSCPGGKPKVEVFEKCKTISNRAFFGCQVNTVIINEGVTRFVTQAFAYCKNLTSINFPASLTQIDGWCFHGTFNINIDIEFGAGFTTLADKSFLSCGFNSLDFSACTSITSIPSSCFENSKMKSIILPSTIEIIQNSAFASCYIDSFKCPDSLTTLSSSCFSSCSSLQTIDFGNSRISEIPDSCFDGSGLLSINIPNSVKTFGNGAFANCVNLTNITFESGSNLKNIFPGIISGCSSLKSFRIQPDALNIGDGAFVNSYGLLNFEQTEANSNFQVIDGILFKSSTILYAYPGGRDYADIDEKITSIYKMAFAGCIHLKSLTFGEKSLISNFDSNTFLNCSSLTNVVLPGSLKSFHSTAFSECSMIETIYFSSLSKLKSIPPNAFQGFGKLSVFEFPNVTEIGSFAFDGCSSLQSIIITSATSIGQNSFRRCSSVTNVLLPSSLQSIGEGAFSSCSKLSKVLFCGSNVFDGSFFKGSPVSFVYTTQKYGGEKFGGLMAIRSLDLDCQIPTSRFTADSKFCLQGITSLFNSLVSNE